MIQVQHAETNEQLSAVRDLMRAFVRWHYQRHSDDKHLIDSYFDPDAFEAELADLPGKFAPPMGRLLIASDNGQPAGCVALRDLGAGVGEMKRMFVYPQFHGRGVGRLLGERVIQEAREIGYHHIRLDTGPKQTEAQGLYRSLGFLPTDAYYELSEEMRDWLVFMELRLG